jgi:hypothetical protein
MPTTLQVLHFELRRCAVSCQIAIKTATLLIGETMRHNALLVFIAKYSDAKLW